MKATKKSSAAKKGASKPKAMKAKRVTKVATGRLAKAMVFKGKKEKTVGGLKKDSLMLNKRGKVVSKRASAHGKKAFARIESWVEAVMAARESLHAKGFVAINGKTLQGKAIYLKAKSLRDGKRLGALSPAPTSSAAPAVVEAVA